MNSGLPKQSVDFCLGRADVLKGDYTLKVVVYYEKKFDGTIIDCEIGGRRTLVSVRGEQSFEGISLSSNLSKILDFEVYEV